MSPRLALPLTVLAAVFATALLAACASEEGDDSRVTVVTTLPVFEDFVRQIGGDRVHVSSLLPAGADPHTYEPTPREVARLSSADIVFSNGLDLEGGSTLDLIDPNLASGASHVRLAEEAVAAGAYVRQIHEGEGGGSEDPHLWLSVDNAREYARAVLDALVEADAAGESDYQTNYQDYLSRLDELDGYVADTLAGLPEANRKLVTTHDAFGYMADYMGLEIAAFVVESPGQEPSAQDVAELVEAIEDSGVPAVFEEPQLGGEATVLERAAEDTGAEVCTLYSGALDEGVPTYIDLMRFNAEEIARCLG